MVGVVGSSPIVPTKIHETEFEKSNSVFLIRKKKAEAMKTSANILR